MTDLPPGFALDELPPGFALDSGGAAPTSKPGEIPGTQFAATPRETPRPQYGVLDRLKAMGEAVIDQALGAVGGTAGFLGGGALGVAKDVVGLAREGPSSYRGNEAKRLSEEGAQRGAEALRGAYGLHIPGFPSDQFPSALGKEYSEKAGQFISENAPAMVAGPFGVVGLGNRMPDVPVAARVAGAAAEVRDMVPRAPVKALSTAEKLARPELESIRAAHDAGYKLTPKAAKAGIAARATETAAGSARLSQELAAHNAENTARLARRDVGLPDDVPASPEATIKIREEAGQDYAAVKDVGQFKNDAQYTKDLDSIIGPVKAATEDYPGLLDSPLFKHIESLRQGEVSTASAVEAVKQLRSKADIAFRAGDKHLGGAYRAAAEAVDNSMDRALGKMAESGDPALADAVDKYRAARVRIAKTYLLDDAMDGKPGEVNAKAYARALKKGIPLTGDARTIAEFGKNFGDEGLAAKKGKSGSIGPTWHDIILGGLIHPSALIAVPAAVARPVARRVLGSELMQKRMAGSKPAPGEVIPEPLPGADQVGGAARANWNDAILGDLTPDWEIAPGAAPAGGPGEVVPAEGMVPAVGEIQPMRPRTNAGTALERGAPQLNFDAEGNVTHFGQPLLEDVPGVPPKRAGEQIPAVPGRPDLPDTMVVGPDAQAAGAARGGETGLQTDEFAPATPMADVNATGEAMQAPDAALARQKQAEAVLQRAQAVQSPEVKKVLETHAAKLALEAKRIKDAADLRQEAALTTDPAVRQALFDHAKRLERAEKVAIGEAKEGLPKEKPAKVEKIPAGEATEVPAEEVVAPNPDLVFETGKGWVKRNIPTGEATELAPETVVYDARGRALEVGRTYKDSKGRRAVWQADGTWKILR